MWVGRLLGHAALFAVSGWFWWDYLRHGIELVSTPAGVLGIAATLLPAGLLLLLPPNRFRRERHPMAEPGGVPAARLVAARS